MNRFLWVSLQIRNLCDSDHINHLDDLRDELGRLPEKLKDVYKVIYDRIKIAAKMTRTIADSTIKWLLCGCRNMSTREFIAAVSIDLNSPRSLSYAEHIKQACRGLVVEDKELDIFQFCHLSAREYFEDLEEYNHHQTNLAGAIACLDTLNIYHDVDTTQPKGLYKYATAYWAVHYQRLPVETRYNVLRSKLRTFLGVGKQPSSTFIQWTETVSKQEYSQVPDPSNEEHESQHPRNNDEGEDVPEGTHAPRYSLWLNLREIHSTPPTILFTLSVFGFAEILQDLNKDRIFNLDAKNAGDNSALHLSAQRLHKSTVDLLLTSGAYPDPVDGINRIPLSYAVEYRHYTISKRLLEYHANPDHRDFAYSSPLLRLSQNEDELFVRLLLDYGASPDFCTDSRGWTPLRWAVKNNNYNIAKLLLNKKAKTDTKDGEGWTALLAAAKNRFSKIVQVLLQYGANPDVCDWDGWTPLARAAERGDLTIASMLLESGAKVDPLDFKRRTPLMWAAKQGHAELVRALLGKGADPRKRDRDGYTVTQQARISRNAVIIGELAEREKLLAGTKS
jgi:ankyrin repeat protein